MRDGFRVIDADRHVLEPSDLFDRYVPARFRGRVRIEGSNQSRRFVDGQHREHESHGAARTTKEKPSFYFMRQCWASCEAGETLVPCYVWANPARLYGLDV